MWTEFWAAVTLLGTPECWGYFALFSLAVYLILRALLKENLGWKKAKPAIKKFLIIFLPSIAIFFAVTLGLKAFLFIPRPCIPCAAIPGNPIDSLFQSDQAVLPGICNPYCETDSSFPSGHSGTAFVVFSSIYLTVRKSAALPLFAIPALVSYSRIALGVHTPLDVLAGALLGLIIPVLASKFILKWHKLK